MLRLRSSLFALVTMSVAVAGCGSEGAPGSVTCDPACPATSTCDTAQGVCVPNPLPDAAVVVGDLAMPACVPACSGLTPYCTPAHHCVACIADDNCPAASICGSGVCVPGCADDARCRAGGMPQSMSCCKGQCVDSAKDVSNCGGCGMACTAGNASAACNAGQCAFGACFPPGYGDCNNDPKDGCEANLHVDTANCSMCGMACTMPNAIPGCSDACYIKACTFGYDDCNDDIADGCETAVLSDARNCGGCGMACSAPPHAKAICSNAACLITVCDQGWTDCDNNPQNGCETQTDTDLKNCGKCANVCAQNMACILGSCTCQQCNIPNSKTKCVNNQCVFDSCVAGYADCNKNTADGCEVNLNSDGKNCSACGMVCPMNAPYCGNGVCGQGMDYGPAHTFTGLTSTHYITQGGCSAANGNIDQDAAYFCLHFYGQPLGKNCVPVAGYKAGMTPNCTDAKMHKRGGCTGAGNDIPNTMCDGGQCKIGNWSECTSGITNLVCHCM